MSSGEEIAQKQEHAISGGVRPWEETMTHRQTARSAGANLIAVLSVITALGALYVPLLLG